MTAPVNQPRAAEPVCPRHPDRVSYVRCQRCERPVCPTCQREAAVGVQCVDCVKAAARTMPVRRTVFGGRLAGPKPVVTMTIIVVTAAMYLVQLLVGDRFTAQFAFYSPYALHEPWRFLTSGFLHLRTVPFHILFNMIALWWVGPELERQFGRARFAVVYLLCAVGGSIGFFVLADPAADSWYNTLVGASGAVFGLFGALIVANRRLRRDNVPLIALLVINMLLGFAWPAIAWQAHLGGFITGIACALILQATAGRGPIVQYAGLAGVFVVLVAVILVRAAFVPAGLLA